MLKLLEVPDVFADACIRNNTGELVFMSCFGRDTSLQQMFAAFSLKPSEGGLSAITLVHTASDETIEGESNRHNVAVTDRLTKIAGRLPRNTLFGNLVHAWIFDPAIRSPDMVSRSAWLLDAELMSPSPEKIESEKDKASRTWDLVRLLSPVPLLDHWQQTVLKKADGLIEDLGTCSYPPLGNVRAKRVTIPAEFPALISALVRTKKLSLIAPTKGLEKS